MNPVQNHVPWFFGLVFPGDLLNAANSAMTSCSQNAVWRWALKLLSEAPGWDFPHCSDSTRCWNVFDMLLIELNYFSLSMGHFPQLCEIAGTRTWKASYLVSSLRRSKGFCCGSELGQLRLSVLSFDQVKNCRLPVSSITRRWEIPHWKGYSA